ncbi:hypothetical protein, partial [Streptomyces sp. NPDC059900]|uniref:hypothetical protein n=1 Tax=Streptomyces sp. NPDC059900 TaxID=3155816 RepID=UPI003CFE93A3
RPYFVLNEEKLSRSWPAAAGGIPVGRGLFPHIVEPAGEAKCDRRTPQRRMKEAGLVMVGGTGTRERGPTRSSRWATTSGRRTAGTIRTCIPARIRPGDDGPADAERAADWNVVRGED